MNLQSSKRVIQINHALSGVYGEDMKSTAFKVNQTRKQVLKKLQRKKKLASIIHDQLYWYLQKFPQQKMGLSQQFVKKKKGKMLQSQQRSLYRLPRVHTPNTNPLTSGAKQQLQQMRGLFRYHLQIQDQSSDSK